jgi:hypothetical protein
VTPCGWTGGCEPAKERVAYYVARLLRGCIPSTEDDWAQVRKASPIRSAARRQCRLSRTGETPAQPVDEPHTAAMCCDRLNTRPVSTVVAALLSGGLAGRHRGPQVVTSIVFDDETRSIRYADVVYTEPVNCNLLILLQGARTRTVRAQLTRQGRLVVRRHVCAMTHVRFRGRLPGGHRDQGRRHLHLEAGACRRMRGVAAAYVQDLDQMPGIAGCAELEGCP